MAKQTVITFESECKQKNGIITITNTGKEYVVDAEFIPVVEKSEELYYVLAMKFLKHLNEN